MVWADGEVLPLEIDAWNAWDVGEPNDENNGEDCMVITNYVFWSTQKLNLMSITGETMDAPRIQDIYKDTYVKV